MTKPKQTAKKYEKPVVDMTFSRIIPCDDGKYARILVSHNNKLVLVGSDEYLSAIKELVKLVGAEKVNEWLNSLNWPQIATNSEK